MSALLSTGLPYPLRRGKVRDVYTLPEGLLIVATDRLSAFDVVLPTGIPGKGRLLTAISNHWFERLSDVCPHHLIETRFARMPATLRGWEAELAGRSVLARPAEVIPIECVVRGYLAGSGWAEYQRAGSVCGVKLPPGLKQCSRLPEPIFTPTTKASAGHDEPITLVQAAAKVGQDLADKLRRLSITLYRRAAEEALARGVIIADTKFEFGLLPGASEPILIDEALTPDSSRFWPAEEYAEGRDQPSFDKQVVRNYLESLSWDKRPPGPELPAEVVERTRRRYQDAYERLTGQAWVES